MKTREKYCVLVCVTMFDEDEYCVCDVFSTLEDAKEKFDLSVSAFSEGYAKVTFVLMKYISNSVYSVINRSTKINCK